MPCSVVVWPEILKSSLREVALVSPPRASLSRSPPVHQRSRSGSGWWSRPASWLPGRSAGRSRRPYLRQRGTRMRPLSPLEGTTGTATVPARMGRTLTTLVAAAATMLSACGPGGSGTCPPPGPWPMPPGCPSGAVLPASAIPSAPAVLAASAPAASALPGASAAPSAPPSVPAGAATPGPAGGTPVRQRPRPRRPPRARSR